MKTIRELSRRASPAPKPQSLAWDGRTLWMGSRATKGVHAIDPAAWTVSWSTTAPGTPWGMTAAGGELRVLCGETADDNRIVRRLVPGTGFDATWALPCPDDSGSQLGYAGGRLHVSQWYPKKVLTLAGGAGAAVEANAGTVTRVFSVPRGICGQVWVDGACYLMTTDAEETTEYWLTRVELTADGKEAAKVEDVARVPFQARALAWDGARFWTNHREANEIVAFTV